MSSDFATHGKRAAISAWLQPISRDGHPPLPPIRSKKLSNHISLHKTRDLNKNKMM